MKSKIRKMYDLTVEFVPGSNKNYGVKFTRLEMCKKLIEVFFLPSQQQEAKYILDEIRREIL